MPDYIKEHEQMVQWNLQHPDDKVSTVSQLQAKIKKQYKDSNPLTAVIGMDETAPLFQVWNRNAEAKTVADKAVGQDGTSTANYWNEVGKKALANAGTIGSAVMTAGMVPTLGLAGTAAATIGGAAGGAVGKAAGDVVDTALGTKYLGTVGGVVGGMLGGGLALGGKAVVKNALMGRNLNKHPYLKPTAEGVSIEAPKVVNPKSSEGKILSSPKSAAESGRSYLKPTAERMSLEAPEMMISTDDVIRDAQKVVSNYAHYKPFAAAAEKQGNQAAINLHNNYKLAADGNVLVPEKIIIEPPESGVLVTPKVDLQFGMDPSTNTLLYSTDPSLTVVTDKGLRTAVATYGKKGVHGMTDGWKDLSTQNYAGQFASDNPAVALYFSRLATPEGRRQVLEAIESAPATSASKQMAKEQLAIINDLVQKHGGYYDTVVAGQHMSAVPKSLGVKGTPDNIALKQAQDILETWFGDNNPNGTLDIFGIKPTTPLFGSAAGKSFSNVNTTGLLQYRNGTELKAYVPKVKSFNSMVNNYLENNPSSMIKLQNIEDAPGIIGNDIIIGKHLVKGVKLQQGGVIAHKINWHGNAQPVVPNVTRPYTFEEYYDSITDRHSNAGHVGEGIDRNVREEYKRITGKKDAPIVFNDLNPQHQIYKSIRKSHYDKAYKDYLDAFEPRQTSTRAQNAAIVSLGTLPIAPVPVIGPIISGIASIPDLVYDWAARKDEPTTSNSLHLAGDIAGLVADTIPGPVDDLFLKPASIVGNIDDAMTASGKDMFSFLNKSKKRNTQPITSQTDSTRVAIARNPSK